MPSIFSDLEAQIKGLQKNPTVQQSEQLTFLTGLAAKVPKVLEHGRAEVIGEFFFNRQWLGEKSKNPHRLDKPKS